MVIYAYTKHLIVKLNLLPTQNRFGDTFNGKIPQIFFNILNKTLV